ncbi:MAG: 3-isopropylmalate dehydratase large subunit [Actinomycetota bacterium]
MGSTITEKILAAHAGKDTVRPDDLLEIDLDVVLANDVTAAIAITEFRKVGKSRVFDKDKVVLVADHYVPGKDVKSAEQAKFMREFAEEQDLTNYYDVGCGGIEHALLPEKGLVKPGDAVIGADSHTCTYGALGAFATGMGSTDIAAAMATGKIWVKVPASQRYIYKGSLRPWVYGKDLMLAAIGRVGVDGALYKAMEFTGPIIDSMSVDQRLSMTNMAIEAGGKNGIMAPNVATLKYVKERVSKPFSVYESDMDAEYEAEYEFDVTDIEPLVAFPHLPSNIKPVGEAAGIKINQSVIGSCTNGRIEDMRVAAAVLKGHKAAKNVRLIIIPATQEIYRQAMKEGLFDIFLDANAAVSTPTCGPCLGGHMGVLAEGERAIATTNRNFMGRMGHKGSEVYLSNPAIAAASAILGRIGSPEEL